MPEPLAPETWVELLSSYLAGLAGACAAAGPGIIGHIKLLALFEAPHYLRISVVSAAHPPTVTGAVPFATEELAVTLNVLVYGLPHKTIAALTTGKAAALAAIRGGWVAEQPLAEGHEHHADHA